MADVRSLLRQERAARQQSGRPKKQSAAPAGAPATKKRKAVDDKADDRKRTRTGRAQGVPADFFDGSAADGDDTTLPASAPHTDPDHETQDRGEQLDAQLPEVPVAIPDPPQPSLRQEDMEDLDAFMKEMEEAPDPPHDALDGYSGAVIEAAPMTAAEVAAKAREEQSAQRGKREEELEAEKDDAARLLEDEFEEMEGLDERVRKLREKREALRKAANAQAKTADVVLPDPKPASYEDEGSESEDEDWDDWRFRPA